MIEKNQLSLLHPKIRLTVAVLSVALLGLMLIVSARAQGTSSSEAKHSSDLSDIVLLKAKPGQSEQLGKIIRELLVHSRKEPGCAIAELNQSAEDPNTWMVYERWRGKDALDTHMKQPYVATFLKQFAELSSEPADVRSYEHRP